MSTINTASASATTTLVISGKADLDATLTLGGKEIKYLVGETVVPLCPALMGAFWAGGLEVPDSNESFTREFTKLHTSGILGKLNVKVVGPDVFYTKKADSDSGFFKPHAELAGWSKVKDGVIHGAIFKFDLSKIAPELFPAYGKESRYLTYSLGKTKVLTVGQTITQAGYDIVARFDEEAVAAGLQRKKNGEWELFSDNKRVRDRDNQIFILPNIGLNKDSLLIMNIVKKASANHASGYRYASESIQIGENKFRPGVTPINGVFYLNHPYYSSYTKEWGVTVSPIEGV